MDVMIYGRARRIDASVDIDPVNDNGRFYPTDSCELAGAVKIASNCVRPCEIKQRDVSMVIANDV